MQPGCPLCNGQWQWLIPADFLLFPLISPSLSFSFLSTSRITLPLCKAADKQEKDRNTQNFVFGGGQTGTFLFLWGLCFGGKKKVFMSKEQPRASTLVVHQLHQKAAREERPRLREGEAQARQLLITHLATDISKLRETL